MSRRIVLVNQDSGYMFIDLVNAFAEKYDEVIFMSGRIVFMHSKLNNKVRICKLTEYNRKNSFTRAFSWVLSTLQVLFYLKTAYRKHELFFSSNPPTLIFILLLLKRPFSLIIYDLYPDGLVIGKFLKTKHPIVIAWTWVNRNVLPKAAAIFTLTNGMAKSLSHYLNCDSVHVISAWSSGFVLPEYNEESNPFIQKYNLNGLFILMYSGNLGKEYEVETLVNLAEKLKEKKDIIVLIAGTGWKYEALNHEISKRQLLNCRLLPKQPVELFQAAMTATNLGVVFLTQSLAKVAIPSKTYNLLAAGKPILCIGGENSDLAMLLQNSSTGVAYSSDKLAEMADFILLLKQNQDVYSNYCKNALAISLEFTAANAQKIVNIHMETQIVRSYLI